MDMDSLTLALLTGNDDVTVAPSTLFAGGVRIEGGTSDSVTETGRTGVATGLDLAVATVKGVFVGGPSVSSTADGTCRFVDLATLSPPRLGLDVVQVLIGVEVVGILKLCNGER